MYAVRVEGLSGKLDDIVTYLGVEWDDKTSVSVSERVKYIICLQATVEFYLKGRGFNIITCT